MALRTKRAERKKNLARHCPSWLAQRQVPLPPSNLSLTSVLLLTVVISLWLCRGGHMHARTSQQGNAYSRTAQEISNICSLGCLRERLCDGVAFSLRQTGGLARSAWRGAGFPCALAWWTRTKAALPGNRALPFQQPCVPAPAPAPSPSP